MRKIEIIKINCGIIKNNNYIIIEGKKCIIIDLSETKDIKEYVEKNNLEVCGILLTHTHWDHLLGVDEFIESYNTPVYISDERPNYICDENFDYTKEKYGVETKFDPEKVDIRLLKEGENKVGNFNFDVIKVPGHTYCSIVFHFKEEGWMFTGDFLFKGTIGITNTMLSNKELMWESLKRIKTYTGDIKVFPGHGDETTLKEEKEKNRFLLMV